MPPDDPSPAHDQNRRVWDRLARHGEPLARPARDEDFADPLKTVDPLGWLGGGIRGRRVRRQLERAWENGGKGRELDVGRVRLERSRRPKCGRHWRRWNHDRRRGGE